MTGHSISTTKVTALLVLSSLVLALGTLVLLLQVQVNQELLIQAKRHQKYQSGGKPSSDSSILSSSGSSNTAIPLEAQPSTVQSTEPASDIFTLQSQPESVYVQGYSTKTLGEAYWKQAASYLRKWDAILSTSSSKRQTHAHHYTTRDEMIPPTKDYEKSNATQYPHLALEKSADYGHPLAQFYLANAHASGIWPFTSSSSSSQEETTTPHSKLQVMEEWLQQDHPQVMKSFLLWHMAAMAGNIEAAMALAHRMDFDGTKKKATDNHSLGCTGALPYLEAAANGIMDQLESSEHSRAKVLPHMDKHVLAQVHMHGGTSSQLDWNNKPDESKEAIQFYHLKATTTPWYYRDSNEKKPTTIDVAAAATLGHFYHFGIRGVQQNLTLALEYYEIAANNNHWEAAGQAGAFYLWGMGTEPDAKKALKYFKLGAPGSFAVCYRKREMAVLQKKKGKSEDEKQVHECDHHALNGMGLLYLLGIPGVMEIDYGMAEKFLALAKESGDTDAHYNLAMMWLGWKTQFQNYPTENEDLPEDGMSSNPLELPTEKEKPAFALHHSGRIVEKQFRGPSQTNIKEAVTLLATAASRGHIQARHRLAMIYTEGIQIQTSALDSYSIVKKDCVKARAHFQWIISNGSVDRSKRLRTAYKEYAAGNLEASLRNYLTAAEGGSNVGQVNAAFLLEQGVCLGLGMADCAKASVRLWKAAADRGNAEACLRLGDFYYYGRLRGKNRSLGPFGWVQYVLYPEKHVLPLLKKWYEQGLEWWAEYQMSGEWKYIFAFEKDPSNEPPQCTIDDCPETFEEENELEDADLSMAAHYYTIAVDKHQSARANFNLGFMHEYGIGLKQDFPLAKRHYDLAASYHAAEASLAVQIALMAMSQHENIVKLRNAWNAWWYGTEPMDDELPTLDDENEPQPEEEVPSDAMDDDQVVKEPVPRPQQADEGVGEPVPGHDHQQEMRRKKDVIMEHIFDHQTLLICVLAFALLQLVEMRARRLQQRR
ncbi:unnamed protein product [Cylindrotheca closterium]|uniref:Uncharacterized protein n=1 Tax=Cylindrotheca closterium TaxID=2856 RepID=A0AAD2JLG6_9STRA|nr:unnamed protein product [Cylindrotheca closterium]